MQFNRITIGVPKEIMPGEKRVAVIPETVEKFVHAGARVLIESGAGQGSFFADEEYRQAGAEILTDVLEVYQNSQMILKVKEPQFNADIGKHEAEFIQENSALVCFLHPAHPLNQKMVEMLARRKITSFTLDGIPRISRAQQMDALTSMSTVAGYKAAIIAAYKLACFIPMMPTAFGLLQPANFLVIGTGVAGLQAIATAKRLGAKVKSLDIRPDANEQAQSLGAEVIPFDLPQKLAVGKGGYALRLPEQWFNKEREILTPHVQAADAVILTALIPGEEAPILVNELMVKGMKKGSVIVDIAADQGGNCQLTRCGEEYLYEGIFIGGLLNVPATLARDSTWMFAQNIWQLLNLIVEKGKIQSDSTDEIIQSTLVTKNGKIVHRGALLAMKARG